MLAQRPLFLWKEKLSETVNPKFIYGYKGWLFIVTGSFLLLGFYRFVAMFDNLIKVFQELAPHDHVSATLWLIVVGLDICLPLCIAFVLYFRWYDPLLISRVCAAILPIAAFAGYWLFSPSEADWRRSSAISFASNAVFFTMPTLLYLGLSLRVRNTYMFWGRRMPARIQCPFCLSRQFPTAIERVTKQMTCSTCNTEIAATSVVNYEAAGAIELNRQ